MPTQIPSSFERYKFSQEEQIQATTFNAVQLMYLKNLRGELAEQKIRLLFDPKNPEDFLQNEAAMMGQLRLLDELIGEN